MEVRVIEYTRYVYCPCCGIAALEEYLEKAMRCTKCGYVYFHNTASAVAGIIEIGDGILVTVRNREPHVGKYDLPGGFVDYNESIEAALQREILEELGIDVEIATYLGSFPNRYVYRKVVYFTLDSFFVCKCCNNKEEIVESKEIHRWKIVPVDDMPLDHFAFESNVRALGLYVEYLQDL